jgi:hypothetical protein
MGHTYAEMDPRGAEEQAKRMERESKIRDELMPMSLADFTVEDLKPLLRITGFDIHQRPNDSDLAHLERRIGEINEGKDLYPQSPYDAGEYPMVPSSVYHPERFPATEAFKKEFLEQQRRDKGLEIGDNEDDSHSTRQGES